ncbi:MAG: RNA polymerase sigma factor region1.1 domain-containing protein [Bradymonadales bacterium]|nr:RNA polymerase sigma factor region1.1 domain-containing protein [Bradymonadales bacterium]
MTGQETHPMPDQGDYHKAKRDLLRLGVERGYLRTSEIREKMPAPHLGIAELELFFFALEALGIRVVEDVTKKEGEAVGQ